MEPAYAPSAPDAEAPPAIADGTVRQLDPRSIELERIAGWIATAILGLITLLGLLIFGLLSDSPPWMVSLLLVVWLGFTLLLVWHTLAWPELAYRHSSYRIDGLGIEIRQGVLWRTIVNVPRSRVQHIDVSQGPLERRFGLGTLSIYTAGTQHSQVTLSGLAHATALAIRDQLLPGPTDDVV